jgi:hypothetical protein
MILIQDIFSKKNKKDFVDTIMLISGIEDKLEYIDSGSTGHVFKGSFCKNQKQFEYSVKVSPYLNDNYYGDVYNIRRPENAEINMLKILSYFVINKQTPHIILPITSFDSNIDVFVSPDMMEAVGENNEKYNNFLENYKYGNKYKNTASIVITEWANRGNLSDFLEKFYKSSLFTPTHWKCIFFQILSTLAVIQSKYPSFRHNSLKVNDILIDKIENQCDSFTYKVARKNYKVTNIGYQIKLWDFDFACIPGIVNNDKVNTDWANKIGINIKQNRYLDLHFFFNNLISVFFPNLMYDPSVPDEVIDFIERIIPDKYRGTNTKYTSERGRLLVNVEYITPHKILENDPYFF